jgi:peptidyl-prolyl cis-trans isomerase A (cyclophilin A)
MRIHLHLSLLRALTAAAAIFCLLMAGCSSAPEESKKEKKAGAEAAIPDLFKVKFSTTKGDFVVEVHKEWAPIGVERFYQLVKDKYYDNAGFFRVVPDFIVQFGLAADPKMTSKWDKKIQDDPVNRTNAVGMVTFATAGPNTRTTQVFINLRSNQALDGQGFAPFGKVVEGMDVVTKISSAHGQMPEQDLITKQGNAYLKRFPRLDYIKTATLL